MILHPFLSYQDNGQMIMKGCVQWNLVYRREDFASSGVQTQILLRGGSNARSVAQSLTHWATGSGYRLFSPKSEALPKIMRPWVSEHLLVFFPA